MSRSNEIDTYNNRDEQLENWSEYQIADGTVHTLERVLEKYKALQQVKEQKNK